MSPPRVLSYHAVQRCVSSMMRSRRDHQHPLRVKQQRRNPGRHAGVADSHLQDWRVFWSIDGSRRVRGGGPVHELAARGPAKWQSLRSDSIGTEALVELCDVLSFAVRRPPPFARGRNLSHVRMGKLRTSVVDKNEVRIIGSKACFCARSSLLQRKKAGFGVLCPNGAPDTIRTCDLCLRRARLE
jgi:hypothetical protein